MHTVPEPRQALDEGCCPNFRCSVGIKRPRENLSRCHLSQQNQWVTFIRSALCQNFYVDKYLYNSYNQQVFLPPFVSRHEVPLMPHFHKVFHNPEMSWMNKPLSEISREAVSESQHIENGQLSNCQGDADYGSKKRCFLLHPKPECRLESM